MGTIKFELRIQSNMQNLIKYSEMGFIYLFQMKRENFFLFPELYPTFRTTLKPLSGVSSLSKYCRRIVQI